jgi:hypothetical protein
MQLVVVLLPRLGRARRCVVGGDRFLPIADAREDMRRHMQRVRSPRRDLRVAGGRAQPFIGDGRIVVGVDQVVRDARMVGLALEYLLQDGRRLKLVGIGLVIRRGGDIEGERVEHLRLVVARIALRKLLHGLEVGLDARAMRDLVVVGKQQRQGGDVVALTRRLRPDRLAFLQRSDRAWQVARRRRADERIIEQAQRDPPIGDGAFGISLEHILENLPRRAVPERMLVSHATVEPSLRRLVARGREMNGAEPLIGFLLAEAWLPKTNPGRCANSNRRCERCSDHGFPR